MPSKGFNLSFSKQLIHACHQIIEIYEERGPYFRWHSPGLLCERSSARQLHVRAEVSYVSKLIAAYIIDFPAKLPIARILQRMANLDTALSPLSLLSLECGAFLNLTTSASIANLTHYHADSILISCVVDHGIRQPSCSRCNTLEVQCIYPAEIVLNDQPACIHCAVGNHTCEIELHNNLSSTTSHPLVVSFDRQSPEELAAAYELLQSLDNCITPLVHMYVEQPLPNHLMKIRRSTL